MGRAPNKCPMCGERRKWKRIDIQHKGFSVGKAAVGVFLFGKYGLLAGTLGNKKETYACGKCGFSHEY